VSNRKTYDTPTWRVDAFVKICHQQVNAKDAEKFGDNKEGHKEALH